MISQVMEGVLSKASAQDPLAAESLDELLLAAFINCTLTSRVFSWARSRYITRVCHSLGQNQQSVLSLSPYGISPGHTQVYLIRNQLNHCCTKLARQQNNIQRMRQFLNDLLHEQQSQPPLPPPVKTLKMSGINTFSYPPSGKVFI
ncbi:hypothetical protein J4Q44_G00388150 [Coregonus suidteri]|uniref:Uncharacterized protein n=1 Tax=Coregonus suidteri TaxID=861788 RepID=A0AAN8KQM6_9TELE